MHGGFAGLHQYAAAVAGEDDAAAARAFQLHRSANM
jgi:hypothetical protein